MHRKLTLPLAIFALLFTGLQSPQAQNVQPTNLVHPSAGHDHLYQAYQAHRWSQNQSPVAGTQRNWSNGFGFFNGPAALNPNQNVAKLFGLRKRSNTLGSTTKKSPSLFPPNCCEIQSPLALQPATGAWATNGTPFTFTPWIEVPQTNTPSETLTPLAPLAGQTGTARKQFQAEASIVLNSTNEPKTIQAAETQIAATPATERPMVEMPAFEPADEFQMFVTQEQKLASELRKRDSEFPQVFPGEYGDEWQEQHYGMQHSEEHAYEVPARKATPLFTETEKRSTQSLETVEKAIVAQPLTQTVAPTVAPIQEELRLQTVEQQPSFETKNNGFQATAKPFEETANPLGDLHDVIQQDALNASAVPLVGHRNTATAAAPARTYPGKVRPRRASRKRAGAFWWWMPVMILPLLAWFAWLLFGEKNNVKDRKETKGTKKANTANSNVSSNRLSPAAKMAGEKELQTTSGQNETLRTATTLAPAASKASNETKSAETKHELRVVSSDTVEGNVDSIEQNGSRTAGFDAEKCCGESACDHTRSFEAEYDSQRPQRFDADVEEFNTTESGITRETTGLEKTPFEFPADNGERQTEGSTDWETPKRADSNRHKQSSEWTANGTSTDFQNESDSTNTDSGFKNENQTGDATSAGFTTAGIAAAAGAGATANFQDDSESSDFETAEHFRKIHGLSDVHIDCLRDAGIGTFGDLAVANPSDLQEYFQEAGLNCSLEDANQWIAQSECCSTGNWDRLANWASAGSALLSDSNELQTSGNQSQFKTVSSSKPAPNQNRSRGGDDLTRINGIGPATAQLLNDNKITSFEQLRSIECNRLQQILNNAGSKFRMIDWKTWGDQARFASQGDWHGLKLWFRNNGTAQSATSSEETRSTTAYQVNAGQADDLTRIHGIGAATAKLLNSNGIHSYEQLCSVDGIWLEKLFADSGTQFGTTNWQDWSQQANFAKQGDWVGLKNWRREQNKLERSNSKSKGSKRKTKKGRKTPTVVMSGKSDDLTLIKGIGPATSKILKKNGIHRFDQIATMSGRELKQVFAGSGARFKLIAPTTWPQKATELLRAAGRVVEQADTELESGLLREINQLQSESTQIEEAPQKPAKTNS